MSVYDVKRDEQGERIWPVTHQHFRDIYRNLEPQDAWETWTWMEWVQYAPDTQTMMKRLERMGRTSRFQMLSFQDATNMLLGGFALAIMRLEERLDAHLNAHQEE